MTDRQRPHLLMICYYFPPWGMGGVQRPLKFAKYLPEFGWDVTVIAPQPGDYFQTDESLLAELPESVRIERLAAWTPTGSLLKTGRANRASSSLVGRWWREWSRVPDDKMVFARAALKHAYALSRTHPFDLIWTTSPPASSHKVGLGLAGMVGWIADFRDVWSPRLNDWGPTPIHSNINRRLYRLTAQSADRLIAANDAITQQLENENPRHSPVVIHNGYDEQDFRTESPTIAEGRPRTIVCPGTFGPDSEPTAIFRTIRQWKQTNPSTELRIDHVGASLGVDVERLARDFNLTDMYHDHGYRPHAESITELCNADVVAIPIRFDPECNAIVPGRIYEALRALRPVLLFASPDNAATHLIRDVPGCHLCDPRDTGQCVAILNQVLSDERGKPVRSINDIAGFERRDQTRCLAELCETVRAERHHGVDG